MSPHHSNSLEELPQRVDEVLHYLWDPIGISDEPGARDEYASYVPGVMSLLVTDASVPQIGKHLDHIVVNQIGLPSNLEHCTQVAHILIAWRKNLFPPPA